MAARADQEEHNEPLTDPISVEAFLNADLVEGFTADSRILPASYYGFQNIVFNRIHGRAPGNGAAGIDNIEFTHAASVPEPATLALVGLGAISAGLRTRWRNRRSQ